MQRKELRREKPASAKLPSGKSAKRPWHLSRARYILPDGFKRLMAAVEAAGHERVPRDRAMLVLAVATGARSIELLSLRWCDINLRAKPEYVTITRAKKRVKEWRDDVCIPREAVIALVKYLKTLPREARRLSERAFPITTRRLRMVFDGHRKAAGLPPGYGPHALRHLRGIMVYGKTKDIELTRKALGHSSISTTQVYVDTVEQMKVLAKIYL